MCKIYYNKKKLPYDIKSSVKVITKNFRNLKLLKVIHMRRLKKKTERNLKMSSKFKKSSPKKKVIAYLNNDGKNI